MAIAQEQGTALEMLVDSTKPDPDAASTSNSPPTASTPTSSTPAPTFHSTAQAPSTTTQPPPATTQAPLVLVPNPMATQVDHPEMQRAMKPAVAQGVGGQRTGTPIRNTNNITGVNGTVPAPMPAKATPNGAPVRQYLNEKVTGVLVEGMKRIAVKQPEDPLRVLGEFFLQKSKELEGTK